MKCHNVDDLRKSRIFFRSCKRVVIEEFLHIQKSLCLGFAATANGEIIYLGCSEQICNDHGKYSGNWFDETAAAPPAAIDIATRTVRAGMERGYYGWVGIDLAILEDGRIVLFDLNFRTNGSTASLLLADSILEHIGAKCMRLLSMKSSHHADTFTDLFHRIYAALDAGLLLPLITYNPAVLGHQNGIPRVTGLILGSDREEVIENERHLADLGLVPRA